MPYFLNASSFIICPHSGRLQHKPIHSPETVLIDGQLAFFHDDEYLISACTVGCQTIQWHGYYQELIFRGSRYFLTNESRPWCFNARGVFNGYALILYYQTKVDTETTKKHLLKKA